MTEDQNWSVNGTSALHIVLRFMEMAVTGDLTISGDYYDVYDSSKYITGTRTDSGGYNTWCSNISGGTMGMGMGAGMGASVIADDTP
jgi:thiamine pyrophosphate-dependent acetolactate synthase large subunit-like protein